MTGLRFHPLTPSRWNDVVFHYSIERSCGLTTVVSEQSAKALPAGDAP